MTLFSPETTFWTFASVVSDHDGVQRGCGRIESQSLVSGVNVKKKTETYMEEKRQCRPVSTVQRKPRESSTQRVTQLLSIWRESHRSWTVKNPGPAGKRGLGISQSQCPLRICANQNCSVIARCLPYFDGESDAN